MADSRATSNFLEVFTEDLSRRGNNLELSVSREISNLESYEAQLRSISNEKTRLDKSPNANNYEKLSNRATALSASIRQTQSKYALFIQEYRSILDGIDNLSDNRNFVTNLKRLKPKIDDINARSVRLMTAVLTLIQDLDDIYKALKSNKDSQNKALRKIAGAAVKNFVRTSVAPVLIPALLVLLPICMVIFGVIILFNKPSLDVVQCANGLTTECYQVLQGQFLETVNGETEDGTTTPDGECNGSITNSCPDVV